MKKELAKMRKPTIQELNMIQEKTNLILLQEIGERYVNVNRCRTPIKHTYSVKDAQNGFIKIA